MEGEEKVNNEVKISGKRKNFKSILIRNIPINLFEKMKDLKNKEGKTYSHQIRCALRFWFEMKE